jgi:hypothetical protein
VQVVSDPQIEQFLNVLLRELHDAEVSARASARVLRMADTPVPMLEQISTGLRFRLPQLEHLANRAAELANDGVKRHQG